MAAPLVPVAERLMRHVSMLPEAGCWIWMSQLGNHGYGVLKVGPKLKLAHRLAYEEFVGPIPDGLHIDHLCRIRYCINPKHLEPVTCAENLKRGIVTTEAARSVSTRNRRNKTHCSHGHEYTAVNTRCYGGSRFCRECQRLYDKARRLTGDKQ